MKSKKVDRDRFINELNERVIGLTIAQSILVSVMAELNDDFQKTVRRRIDEAVSAIPEEMRTPTVMEQIDFLLASTGRDAMKGDSGKSPPFLRIIRGGKPASE